MKILQLDYIVIFTLLLTLGVIAFFITRKGFGKYDYFRGNPTIHWFQIGASILTTNIAFEYVISSASNGFQTGLAFGTYEWTATFVMVFVAIYVQPKFLSAGIATLPEYLQLRFNKWSRMLMAILFILLNFAMLIIILYSGGMFIEQLLNIPKAYLILFVSAVGFAIVYSGGTYAKMKVELLIFLVFMITITVVLILSLYEIGGIKNLINGANGRLRVALPMDDPDLPWTTVFIGGLWMLHLKYWAFFQPIAQNTLLSNTLSSTQKGYLFAATVKLFTPFLMILPGIVCYELYPSQVSDPDDALAVLLKNIAPGITGQFIIAGLILTIIGTYLGYFNSLSVVFARDIWSVLTPQKEDSETLKKYTRRSSLVFVILISIFSYFFSKEVSIFKFTQIAFLCIGPVSVAVFLTALISKRTPTLAVNTIIFIGAPIFFLLMRYTSFTLPNTSGITFLILTAIIIIWRFVNPSKTVNVPEKFAIKFERNLGIVIWGIFLLSAVLAIYMILL